MTEGAGETTAPATADSVALEFAAMLVATPGATVSPPHAASETMRIVVVSLAAAGKE